jgi:pyruvate dehydrogenase E1 component alpha subunit
MRSALEPLELSPDPLALAKKALLRDMLVIRRTEETIADLYKEQQMRCPVHLCIGQEAIAVGACAPLGPDDYVMSGHRAHGHYLARGGDLKAMVAEMYGKITGCSKGIGGSMHLVDLSVGFLGATPILGSTIPIAVGAAFAATMRREERVTMVFFGDGATEEGVLHESLNFAALKRLPVVFVCENNFYSVYSPLSVRQPEGRAIVRIAEGHGVRAETGDGNDVEDVERRTRRAVDQARGGGGPSFLEFTTYRHREHCGPAFDDHLGYRPPADVEAWLRACPIQRFEKELLRMGVVDQPDLDEMRQGVEAEIRDAVTFAKESPFPSPDRLAENVYAT